MNKRYLLQTELETIKDNLKLFLDLSAKDRTKLLDIASSLLQKRNVSTSYVNSEAKANGIETQDLQNTIFILFRVIPLCKNEQDLDLFLSEMSGTGFSNNEIEIFKTAYDKLVKKDTISNFYDFIEYDRVASFGLPNYESFNIMVDYRTIVTHKGEKEIIPILISEIRLQSNSSNSNNLVFQLPASNLDEIIKALEIIKEEIEKDLSFLRPNFSS